jgi:hypothetical protein
MGWHSTVSITRDVAKAFYIRTYMGTSINLNKDIPDSVLEEFLDEVLYDSGYNTRVVTKQINDEYDRDGDSILEYESVQQKMKELSWGARKDSTHNESFNESALELAARHLFTIGVKHSWYGPYVKNFDDLDSIEKDEFLDIVARILATYNQNS